ncbi:glycoside hydrolase family 5 protein, partial [Lacrimispora saccharolytica]|nr:glycoside hydrolase family 5 protein [Lacrimispora saccharolytica]
HADASQSTDADAPASVKSIACPSVDGALHVDGRQLTDEHGNAVQLKGISTHGLAWFPDYVNQKDFHQLRQEWNVNVIRLAMYTTESGGYCTDGDQGHLKSLIDQGVSYDSSEDMYVIIDWHILSD